MKNIYNIEKDLFSLVHSEFDKMLYNINNNKNKITNKELSMFMELNKEILNIRNLMENINNSLLKKNKPNLDKLIGNYNLNNYHYYKSKKISINMNWKLAVDTFLEIYHIDSLHDKTLSSIIMSDLALFDSFGQNIRLIGARTSVLGSKKRLLTNKEFITHTLQLHIIFPNTIVVTHPEHIEVWHVLPGQKENKCEVSLSLFSREKASTVSAKKHWENNFKLAIDVVEEEDFPLGEDVQKGFYADTKRKLIFGKNEPGLQHFHKKIDEALKNG